jgi:hypothetical protein
LKTTQSSSGFFWGGEADVARQLLSPGLEQSSLKTNFQKGSPMFCIDQIMTAANPLGHPTLSKPPDRRSAYQQ